MCHNNAHFLKHIALVVVEHPLFADAGCFYFNKPSLLKADENTHEIEVGICKQGCENPFGTNYSFYVKTFEDIELGIIRYLKAYSLSLPNAEIKKLIMHTAEKCGF